ncbi:iron uptake system component EfeO [Friedmanniella luteola]|uniref:Iron uptake system component EfeO n=1 Tax=Friedmanniella luteola TaxID=546871 RepID=A0A1H1L376_9ACTN|nr:iron uptake system protein EfeO [Friedmanniella luteola]SDR68495.1 iron uptake system component EfeO [Friedmanniella luteola]
MTGHHPQSRRRTRPGLALASASALLLAPLLAGCTDNASAGAAGDTVDGDGRALTVRATDDGCQVSADTAPSGNLTFSVTNAGAKVTEFYLLAADGLRIVGEVENIGPGLSRELVLAAPAGSYFTACKPGMVGDGIRAPFAVSDSGDDLAPSGDDQQLVDQANASYASYIKDQTEQLVTRTDAFAAAYTAGDDAEARALYPQARVHWERIETVAESFGDLDPKMDLREADLEPGQKWTGWHRMEKDLWPARAKGYEPLSPAERTTFAKDLVKNTATLNAQVRTLSFTADQIANGTRGLLDEVAKSKVTGEEEYWSRTDLWDFQANVDGARVGFEGLRQLLQRKDPTLDTEIDERFTALQALLDQHRKGDGFVSYDALSSAEVKALSDAVNALSEPLSKLTAAVV